MKEYNLMGVNSGSWRLSKCFAKYVFFYLLHFLNPLVVYLFLLITGKMEMYRLIAVNEISLTPEVRCS